MKRIVLYTGLALAFIWNIVTTILMWATFVGVLVSTTVALVDEMGIILGIILGIPLGALMGGFSAWVLNFVLGLTGAIAFVIGAGIYRITPGQDPLAPE